MTSIFPFLGPSGGLRIPVMQPSMHAELYVARYGLSSLEMAGAFASHHTAGGLCRKIHLQIIGEA